MMLSEQWRAEANEIMKQVRKGNYYDQADRVRLTAVAKTLRKCARQVYNRHKKIQKEAYNG